MEVRRALDGYTKSYRIGIKSNKSALEQMHHTRREIGRHFGNTYKQMGGFKFVETLVINFLKPTSNNRKD